MHDPQKRYSQRATARWLTILAVAFLVMGAARCESTGPATFSPGVTTLRIGVGEIELGPFIQNQTLESLAKMQEDGRLKPSLAQNWTVSSDGLSVTAEVRPGVHFHDGSTVTAAIVATVLQRTLPKTMGFAYDDVLSITALDGNKVELKLKRPSTFALEAAFEAQVEKPDRSGVGTGPFVAANHDGVTEMRANSDYYLGRPSIDRIVVSNYPSVRTAWAEMLRNNVDMVYEVGVDALNSLETASAISVFSFVRRYQYAIVLNSNVPALRSAPVRRGLNAAIDRNALIRDALNGHGLPSLGPVWPKHWAFSGDVAGFTFDPKYAMAALGDVPQRSQGHDGARRRLAFTCLVAPDAARIALIVKQQLEPYGVEMTVEETPLAEINKAGGNGKFEAILAPMISAPTIFRPNLWWHSHGPLNRGNYSSTPVDTALDAIRDARSDDEYRRGVADFQRSIVADPPAIFLAWDERARAVSNRFDVPVEQGVDILGALRLWRPVAGAGQPHVN